MQSVPDGAVRPLETRYWQLYIATGRLFLDFAKLENTVSSALRLHLCRQFEDDSRRAIALASAIFGSQRFKASKDVIKRIMASEKAGDPATKFVAGVFEQIGHVEKLRDLLAHQAIIHSEASDHWIIADFATTKDVDNYRLYAITDYAIECAADDLRNAAKRLVTADGAKLYVQDDLDRSPIAWRYKHTELRPHRLGKGQTLAELFAPPEPSRG